MRNPHQRYEGMMNCTTEVGYFDYYNLMDYFTVFFESLSDCAWEIGRLGDWTSVEGLEEMMSKCAKEKRRYQRYLP